MKHGFSVKPVPSMSTTALNTGKDMLNLVRWFLKINKTLLQFYSMEYTSIHTKSMPIFGDTRRFTKNL